MFESYTRVITYLCFLSQIHPSLHLSIQLFFEVFILCHELLNLILFEEKCTDLKMFETGMSCQLLVTVLQIVCPLIPSVLLWESAFPSHGTVWVLRKSRQSRIYQSMRGNIVIFKNWSNKCNIYSFCWIFAFYEESPKTWFHLLYTLYILSINTTPKPNTHIIWYNYFKNSLYFKTVFTNDDVPKRRFREIVMFNLLLDTNLSPK